MIRINIHQVSINLPFRPVVRPGAKLSIFFVFVVHIPALSISFLLCFYSSWKSVGSLCLHPKKEKESTRQDAPHKTATTDAEIFCRRRPHSLPSAAGEAAGLPHHTRTVPEAGTVSSRKDAPQHTAATHADTCRDSAAAPSLPPLAGGADEGAVGVASSCVPTSSVGRRIHPRARVLVERIPRSCVSGARLLGCFFHVQ